MNKLIVHYNKKHLKYMLVIYKYHYKSTNTLSKFPLTFQRDNFKSFPTSFVKYKIGHNAICRV